MFIQTHKFFSCGLKEAVVNTLNFQREQILGKFSDQFSDSSAIVSKIGVNAFRYLYATYDRSDLSDIFPASVQPVDTDFTLTGRINSTRDKGNPSQIT